VTDETVQRARAQRFEPTTNYEALPNVSGVSICVPTPLRKSECPNMSFVVTSAEQLALVIPDGCTVILECTIYP
jgi:UDP-N-acetyl-D-glucosamine dehydrogenase